MAYGTVHCNEILWHKFTTDILHIWPNPKSGEITNFYPIFMYLWGLYWDFVERKLPYFDFMNFPSCQWPVWSGMPLNAELEWVFHWQLPDKHIFHTKSSLIVIYMNDEISLNKKQGKNISKPLLLVINFSWPVLLLQETDGCKHLHHHVWGYQYLLCCKYLCQTSSNHFLTSFY